MLTRLQLGAHHLLQTRLQALGVLSKEKSKFCGAQGQVKNSTQTERSQKVPNVGVSTLRSRRRRAHWNTHTHKLTRTPGVHRDAISFGAARLAAFLLTLLLNL